MLGVTIVSEDRPTQSKAIFIRSVLGTGVDRNLTNELVSMLQTQAEVALAAAD